MVDLTSENPFGVSDQNPFSAVTEWDSQELVPAEEEEVDIGKLLESEVRRIRAGKVEEKITEVASYLSGFVSAAIGVIWTTSKQIVKQALQMAMFKFAIEACAMGIKTLVELMAGMSLTPPNIDTKGVFYNIGSTTNQSVSSPTQQTFGPTPSYGNPFGSPFAGSTAW